MRGSGGAMRSLAATALTLAFVVMAAITYLAIKGDPLGGEPRLAVKIAAPDLDKLQPTAPQAAAPAPSPATVDAGLQDAAPAIVPGDSSAPRTSARVPSRPASAPGENSSSGDFAGVGVAIPQ